MDGTFDDRQNAPPLTITPLIFQNNRPIHWDVSQSFQVHSSPIKHRRSIELAKKELKGQATTAKELFFFVNKFSLVTGLNRFSNYDYCIRSIFCLKKKEQIK